VPESIPLFEIFSKQVKMIIETRTEMAIADVIALQVSLLNLAINCYPDNLAYVDEVLGVALERLRTSEDNKQYVARGRSQPRCGNVALASA